MSGACRRVNTEHLWYVTTAATHNSRPQTRLQPRITNLDADGMLAGHGLLTPRGFKIKLKRQPQTLFSEKLQQPGGEEAGEEETGTELTNILVAVHDCDPNADVEALEVTCHFLVIARSKRCLFKIVLASTRRLNSDTLL